MNLSYITINLRFWRNNTLISNAANHGIHRLLWTIFACFSQRCALTRSLAMPPLTGAIQIERGRCDFIHNNQPVISQVKHTVLVEVAHRGIHCLLALYTHYGPWCALIWSLATRPITGAIPNTAKHGIHHCLCVFR